MKVAVRTLADLGPALVLAPERQLALALATEGEGTSLGELVVERTERASPDEAQGYLVLDTTHARDGLLDVRGALRDGAGTKSSKKVARAGDLLVSRLRPYLRQIALVHPAALALAGTDRLCVSPEFYVLAPASSRAADASLAWLLPFLLGEDAQAMLAGAQEGGHHPRVPRDSLLAMRVPRSVVRGRAASSRTVEAALAEHYRAAKKLSAILGT